MQDLVGCRAIVNSITDIQEILSKYKSIEEGGRVRRKTDYIKTPKASGYRSVHLVVKFDENGIGEKHAGCNVELQLRTQLQHVWGTTVEAAGAMRNEDLKAGEGSAEWLRFLTLMSGYIAELEEQNRGDHLLMSYKDLKTEAKQLANSLNVRQNLSTFRSLMREAETNSGFHGSEYMIRMDTATGNIYVKPAWRKMFDLADLDDDFHETKESLQVSVDNMAVLRQAYPNYFADTYDFLEVLGDLEGATRSNAKTTINKLDLSFLPKSREKVLHLEYTGNVFWREKFVGTWEKEFYGTQHFFRPESKHNIVIQGPNLEAFKENLEDWLKSR